MRLIRASVYVGLVTALATPLIAGAQQPISLTLTAPTQPAKAGEPVVLLATVTNTSTKPTNVALSNGSADLGLIYQVHVLDERTGQPVPHRPAPNGRTWAGSIPGTRLNQGQSKEDRLNLSYIYDLSRPGKYNIWIAEPYGGPPATGLIVSNAVNLTVVASPSAAPKQEPPFALSLEGPKQQLKLGQVLLLRVNVTNTSDSALTVPDSEGVFAIAAIYQVRVSDQDGRPVPPRPPAKAPGGRGTVVHGGSVQGRTLNPGESFTDLVNVTDEYDLSQPGKYQISVAEPYGSGPDRGFVVSNTVTVAVVK